MEAGFQGCQIQNREKSENWQHFEMVSLLRLVMVRLVVIGAGARINMVVNTKDISVSLNHVHSPSLSNHSMLLSHVPA